MLVFSSDFYFHIFPGFLLCLLLLIFVSLSVCGDYPAGTQRWNNIDSTLIQRWIDVVSMSFACWVPCMSNSSYSVLLIDFKFCRSYGLGLNMCFWQYHFFGVFHFAIYSTFALLSAWGFYLVCKALLRVWRCRYFGHGLKTCVWHWYFALFSWGLVLVFFRRILKRQGT